MIKQTIKSLIKKVVNVDAIKKSIATNHIKLTWLTTKAILPFLSHKTNPKNIMVIPAANLEGGFGEDIMVASFVENFGGDSTINIYTADSIYREDYLPLKKDLHFISGFNFAGVNYLSALKLIRKQSLVYVIGADIMDGTYGEQLAIDRLRVLEISHQLKIDAQISGFSVSNKILPAVKAEFIKLSKFLRLKGRDIDSYKRLESFIPSDRLILTNDIAFICPDVPAMYNSPNYTRYTQWCDEMTKANKKIIAVCPNSIQAKKFGLERYIADLKTLLEKFAALDDYAFTFLYHDIRVLCENESDSTISKTLYDYFTNKNINCFYTDEIKNGVELKGYLKTIEFTVTGRMHFGISGITHIKPMFGIAYANKFEGMLRLFNIDPEFCLIDYDKMPDAGKSIEKFVANLEINKQKIKEKLGEVRENCKNNFAR